jgi:hypothetical protein
VTKIIASSWETRQTLFERGSIPLPLFCIANDSRGYYPDIGVGCSQLQVTVKYV